ncbi:MAG: hypothetical protein LBF90_01450 [Prevotellaceae bacterium]|jgi:hypothetical protein|nr:hypothetical protein [Prevotellaceae bacterium]
MPKSKHPRKHKKRPSRPAPPGMPFFRRHSQTYLRHMETVGRKLLRLAGADGSFLDRLTKTQLHTILNTPCEKPHVVIKKGSRVPRAYLRYIHSTLFSQFETTCVKNNEEIGLSLADMASYGIAFIEGLRLYLARTNIVRGEEQAVKEAIRTVEQSQLLEKGLTEQIIRAILYQLMSISQVQFRLYGFRGQFEYGQSDAVYMSIILTSVVPESAMFQHFGKWRKAYRVCMGPMQSEEIYRAAIRYSAIFPTCAPHDDRTLSIYIQSHAVCRMKERLRILTPVNRMMLLYTSLLLSPRIVRGPDEQPLFVASIFSGDVYGYFPFIIQHDKLFILSFLPVTSFQTPEGKRLQEILHLSTKDITYLGMDSLQFLYDVDLEQIPVLKNALIRSGIYRIKEQNHTPPPPSPPEVVSKQTLFVKKFFETIPPPDDPAASPPAL